MTSDEKRISDADEKGLTMKRDEIEYIKRVAGKVPLKFIAEFLKVSESTIRDNAKKLNVSLRVPSNILIKYWPEYCPPRWIKDD